MNNLLKKKLLTHLIEPLRQHSLVTLAQHELERRIISDEIPAGTKLNEADIAAALGVSRGPVREAFRALGQAGLVRVEKNRGVFVREVSLTEASDFYEVRAALEGLIGKLAAQRIVADEIAQLRVIVKKMHAGSRSRKADTYFALNVEFHDLLARAARNSVLLSSYRNVVNQLDLYRRATISHSADNIPLSTKEHEAIVDAIEAGDQVRAGELLTAHVLASRARLRAALAPASQQTPAKT
ncbi:MAG: FCD domain-containing protein [Betaproteobacteria bacterium]